MAGVLKLREKFASEEGSITSHAIAIGIGAVALGAVLFGLRSCNPVTVEPKTELKINAQVVADVINLPASLNVVSISGGSSSAAELGIDVGVGVGSFSHDFSIGDIPFPNSIYGEDSIEYEVLKDSSTNTAKPNTLNTDKNIKLSVEQENGKDVLIIEADPDGFSANTKNIQSGNGTVTSDGLISFFRSVPPEIASQITTGAHEWNVENFRRSCAKDITGQKGVIEAGLAKAIAVEIQVIAPVILSTLAEKYPDHPEVLKQATDYIATLSDPANMRVRFTSDPNNEKANHVTLSPKDIAYMQEPNLTGDDMANKIGLNKEYVQSITLNDSSSTCNLSDNAKKDIQDILAMWRAATPYDDAAIANKAEKDQ